MPTLRARSACCARAASGHVAAVPPMSVMKSRRRISPSPEPQGHALRNGLCYHFASELGAENGTQSSQTMIRPMSGPGLGRSLIPGLRSRLSKNVLAGFMVLSAVGACPPHDGVG